MLYSPHAPGADCSAGMWSHLQCRHTVSVQLHCREWAGQGFFLFSYRSWLSCSGDCTNLSAFTPTDGTNSWTFTRGLVGMANPYLGCFLFGTASTGLGAASTGLIGGPCAVGISGTGFQPGLQFTARADYLQLLAPIQNSSSAADSGRPMRRETSAISVMPRAG